MPETNENIIAFFGRMEDKIEALTASVNEYKTSTAVIQSQHAEKIVQAEEKIKQLFVFHNEDEKKFTEILTLIKENRHSVGTLQTTADYHDSELGKAERATKIALDSMRDEQRESIKELTKAMNNIGRKIDDNDKEDAARENQKIGKGQWFKAFSAGVGALAGIASVGALIWTIFH